MQRNPMLDERCDMMSFPLRSLIHRETCFIANIYGLPALSAFKKKKKKKTSQTPSQMRPKALMS
jgi:hypothetical protein